MDRHIRHDYAASNVLAWTASQSANVEPSTEDDAGAEVDEPPDHRQQTPKDTNDFKRAPVRRGSEHHESLLTKALLSHSDDETGDINRQQNLRRRRSITSNFSISSAADYSCDTGVTTPARTSSPSPQMPNMGFVPLVAPGSRRVAVAKATDAKGPLPANTQQQGRDPVVQALEKKRCISFACAAKPKADDKALMPPPPPPSKPAANGAKSEDAPKKSSIRFACPSRVPTRGPGTQQQTGLVDSSTPRSSPSAGTSVAKPRTPSGTRSTRPGAVRRSSQSPVATRSRNWLTANPKDLESECSRFHEFASDEPQEDDWILHDDPSSKPRITIDDTLKKENAIRKLGKEAEEEADQEEEDDNEADGSPDGDDEENADDDEDIDNDDEDDEEDEGSDDGINDVESEYAWNDEASDGYKTDTETGFAESEDEDDDLVLWTTRGDGPRSLSGATTVYRRPSIGEHSDSSDNAERILGAIRAKRRERHLAVRSNTPELPDSTDFVCGTLDEDRPLEEAYISHVAARKKDKMHLIPQDIDPSFPTSEPEDEAEELYKKGYGESDDHLWIHGELEDIHQERGRLGRKKETLSPKRCRSPPPKRRHSPAPKPRGRSPRRLFEHHHSPLRLRSPAASPLRAGEGIAFKSLAFRPGLTHTKSLPRGSIMFPQIKVRRSRTNTMTRENHVRGAIDIVKGLEQKRQRRKEKFYQKYCNRARKEKAQVKRPVPGQGAQRMREVGLIMAGKIPGQGNYVLSV